MSKLHFQVNNKVVELFDDLDKFLDFCRDFGYRFNEDDLYNFKSYAWQQYSKFSLGKKARNMWTEDFLRFSTNRL